MRTEVAEKIIRSYGLQYAAIHGLQKGYRNKIRPATLADTSKISVILYKDEPQILGRIKNAHSLARFLKTAGFPVRAPLCNKIAVLSYRKKIRFAAVYNYLPGKTIPWEGYTRHHIKLLGAVMSNMHASLADYNCARFAKTADVIAEYSAINERMKNYFLAPAVKKALGKKLDLRLNDTTFGILDIFLKTSRSLPGQQALHMDFVRSNILFSKTVNENDSCGISGILDFEKASFGPVLFDIGRTLAFLLVDCKYKSEEKIRKYFLHSGYLKRGKNTLVNVPVSVNGQPRPALELLVQMFLLHDFYKFLKHNPYEFLRQNEHFLRTRDLLVRYNLLIPLRPDITVGVIK